MERFDVSENKRRILALEKANAEAKQEKVQSELETSELQNRLYIVVGGLVIALLFALLLFSRYVLNRRRNQRLESLNLELEARNQEIAQKNEEIRKQSKLVARKNAEILKINSGLGVTVADRTRNLVQANQELDLFLYQSSHALRGPLMRIMGLISLMKTEEDVVTREAIRERVEFTIRTMDRILYKLMDVSALKRRQVRPAVVELKRLVSDQISEIERKMGYPECEAELLIPEGETLLPDRQLFTILMRSVLENALHFRHGKRRHKITVEAIQEGDLLTIRVRDNGAGIPLNIQENIFDMFFRGTEKSPGVGLGLYLVAKALDMLDGTPEVESVEGEFTEFRLMIPGTEAIPLDPVAASTVASGEEVH
ncbi:MAG: HAMP domain-containing sensor histidine kinase [Bacteroidota bacterium]